MRFQQVKKKNIILIRDYSQNKKTIVITTYFKYYYVEVLSTVFLLKHSHGLMDIQSKNGGCAFFKTPGFN